jgi:hypothetical protein
VHHPALAVDAPPGRWTKHEAYSAIVSLEFEARESLAEMLRERAGE